jgi:hypothetical protein
MKRYVEITKVLFDELVVHPLFASDPTPLLQMERAGILLLVRNHDRPYYVKPGRPLYSTAFKKMMEDTKLNSYMSMLSAKWLNKQYTQKIRELEDELNSLRDEDLWWFWGNGMASRRKWLKQTIGLYHEKAKIFFETEDRLKAKLKLVE